MRHWLSPCAVAALVSNARFVHAAQTPYSIATTADINQTAADVAWDMLQYYRGNLSGGTPGILPGPPPIGDYYWWEGGAMWGTLIDYWFLTGDSTYNNETMQAMLWQVGPHQDYMPPNVTASLGNDDQGFWGMSAMLAAENKFPDPPPDQPQWLALAQAVFNTMASPERHDQTCNGGLRWQIPFSNAGYDYKNSIANGCFFNIGARLARYTKNETYADWAEKEWNWLEGVGFLDSTNYAIYDGALVETNCTQINKAEFSYNNAVWALGAAYMWNHTSDAKWKTRVNGLVKHGLETFFPNGIAFELACETFNSCSTDELSFKGYIHRWYSTMTVIAPFTASTILPVLKKSAQAAISTCTGGSNGRQCGFSWVNQTFDGKLGAGQQMSVVGAVSSLLIGESRAPVTQNTGGTSKGNPNAGSQSNDNPGLDLKPITAGDRAGAGIVTIIIVASICILFGWMSVGESGARLSFPMLGKNADVKA